jgi:hypothetical protein
VVVAVPVDATAWEMTMLDDGGGDPTPTAFVVIVAGLDPDGEADDMTAPLDLWRPTVPPTAPPMTTPSTTRTTTTSAAMPRGVRYHGARAAGEDTTWGAEPEAGG